jgi:hypothetical protein
MQTRLRTNRGSALAVMEGGLMKKSKANVTVNRQKNYKIGTIHGKTLTENRACENEIRNQLYFIGELRLKWSKTTTTRIRLIGYETPLGHNRDNCIDLLGYDEEHNPYLIELKKQDTSDIFQDIINQLGRYETDFKKILQRVSAEIADTFLFREFNLTDKIIKIALIPREYYKNDKIIPVPPYKKCGVIFCSFARMKKIYDDNGYVCIADQAKNRGYISLRIENQK